MASKFFRITDVSAMKYTIIPPLCVLSLHFLLPSFDIFVNRTDKFSQRHNYKAEGYSYIRHKPPNSQPNFTIAINIHTNDTGLYLLNSHIYLDRNPKGVSVHFQKTAAEFMRTSTNWISTAVLYDCGLRLDIHPHCITIAQDLIIVQFHID